jgi:hypothetical protein
MANRALGIGVCYFVVIFACGGKAVVDPPGSHEAGGGHSATTSGSGGTTITTGEAGSGAPGDPCVELELDLTNKNAEAIACNPAINMPQCTGTAYVLDTCGCQILANETNPSAVQAAQQAYQAWVGAGCGPWPCDTCPVTGPGGCIPGPNGTGTCQTIMPD